MASKPPSRSDFCTIIDASQSYPLTLTVGSTLGFIVGGFASFAQSALEVLKRDVADDVAKPGSVASEKSIYNKTVKVP